MGVAAIHVLVAGFQYRGVLLTALERGIFNTVAGDSAVGAVVWSLLFGILAGIGGFAVAELEAFSRPLPKLLGWSLLSLAILGCVLVPISGFWLLFPPAITILATKTETASRQDGT